VLPFVYRWEYVNKNSAMYVECVITYLMQSIHNLQLMHVIILFFLMICNMNMERNEFVTVRSIFS
jgi:hypothetical protein